MRGAGAFQFGWSPSKYLQSAIVCQQAVFQHHPFRWQYHVLSLVRAFGEKWIPEKERGKLTFEKAGKAPQHNESLQKDIFLMACHR